MLLVFAAACGGRPPGEPPPECESGMSVQCACPDGTVATQECGDDRRWGPCGCVEPECVPGRSDSCTCADGRAGARECDGSGSWQQCLCTGERCTPGELVGCSCTDGRAGSQTCQADGSYGGCDCPDPCAGQDAFCLLQQQMVGTWEGWATPPTSWANPYRVRITFQADGHYLATCLDADCLAFYYGTDADLPSKTYSLRDLLADGTGVADIVLAWDGGTTNTGSLDAIQIAGDQMTFQFWATWSAPHQGPILYDLTRTP